MTIDENEPWTKEPDELRFTDEVTGLECYIWRHSRHGTLNGYIIIPKDNILYNKYEDSYADDLKKIEVHGGITFADINNLINEYCIGFDCLHSGEFAPYSSDFVSCMLPETPCKGTYKDIEYVKSECMKLAKQLHELMKQVNLVSEATQG